MFLNCRTTRRRTFTMNLSGYEDLGVDTLDNDEIVKRRRYLNPDNSVKYIFMITLKS